MYRFLAVLPFAGLLFGQSPQAPPPRADSDVTAMVGRLSLDRYKSTIKGLTEFGDRRQGTERNRKALDWIETQLRSYGCTDMERLTYLYQPAGAGTGASGGRGGRGGSGAAGGSGRGGTLAQNVTGGARRRGNNAPVTVNNDPLKQTDEKLRALNTPPSVPGERQEIYCTKVGSTRSGEMYIVSAHFDGIGFGEAADDDGSGTALVMELARVMSSPDVVTDRSVRFALWNNEESGLNGAAAYVAQRKDMQGKESPTGSGKYPEPKWLGMIQHDMLLFDHGMPDKDHVVSKQQRPEADVNIEYLWSAKAADASMALAHHFQLANEKYATDYPAAVGPHMTNTDSAPFEDLVPTISLRENERGAQIGLGWNPNYHQATDVYSAYSDDDFRLGLNAAQTTLGAVAELVGAKLKK